MGCGNECDGATEFLEWLLRVLSEELAILEQCEEQLALNHLSRFRCNARLWVCPSCRGPRHHVEDRLPQYLMACEHKRSHQKLAAARWNYTSMTLTRNVVGFTLA